MRIVMTKEEFTELQTTLFNRWRDLPSGYEVASIKASEYAADATIELQKIKEAPDDHA